MDGEQVFEIKNKVELSKVLRLVRRNIKIYQISWICNQMITFWLIKAILEIHFTKY